MGLGCRASRFRLYKASGVEGSGGILETKAASHRDFRLNATARSALEVQKSASLQEGLGFRVMPVLEKAKAYQSKGLRVQALGERRWVERLLRVVGEN